MYVWYDGFGILMRPFQQQGNRDILDVLPQNCSERGVVGTNVPGHTRALIVHNITATSVGSWDGPTRHGPLKTR